MSLPSAMRSSLRRTGTSCSRCRHSQMAVMPFTAWTSLTPSGCRRYANQWPKARPKFDLPDKYKEEVFRALTDNPPVMQALHNVIESLDKRGIKLDKEPDVSEMWRIMKDKEIINNLQTLSKISKESVTDRSILKSIDWSKDNEKWAKTPSADPTFSWEAMQKRIKTIRKVLGRPDPGPQPEKPGRTPLDNPLLEPDRSTHMIGEEEEVSLGQIQGDLRTWWKGDEEAKFLERLARLKTKMGDDIDETVVYDFWIDEWSRKVKEIAKV